MSTPTSSANDAPLTARRLILTGISSDQCVLFTANDAHVREFELVVPSDGVSAPEAAQTRRALTNSRKALDARMTSAGKWRA